MTTLRKALGSTIGMTFGLAAAVVVLGTSAQAGSFSVPVNGGTVRIDFDERCRDKLCGTVTWREHGAREAQQFDLPAVGWKDIESLAKGKLGGFGGFGKDDDEDDKKVTAVPAPQWNVRPTAKAPAGQPPVATPAPAPTAPVAAPVAPPAQTTVAVPPPPPAPPPVGQTDPAPVATAPVAPAPAAAPVPAPAPVPEQRVAVLPPAPAPAPVAAPTGPVGLWMTEKKEGMVRVEPCGQNLCGYSVDAKTGRNGEKVLIDMKASGDGWKGRIKDTRNGGGGIYDSTLAMKGADKMRVQGCAFGGMFCGGQTWTRVN
ncbi:DUF2147 domain-containing protein [Rhodoplanes azumiensis]|uniref:DUF2147 domain-containing protein n=1 Tax=Rhodoplanes azumiensis TaxID=1897628 RepID=A0ABW5ACF4_9BRAD